MASISVSSLYILASKALNILTSDLPNISAIAKYFKIIFAYEDPISYNFIKIINFKIKY